MKNSVLHFKRTKFRQRALVNSNVKLTTSEIIVTEVGHVLHLLPKQDLKEQRVSSLSFWNDDGWIFDVDKPGAEKTGINWNIQFPDGTKLTDYFYEGMLDWLKRFVWSLLVTPRFKGTGKSISAMDGVNVGMKVVVKWMQKFSIFYPYKINENVVADFIDDLPQLVERDGPLTHSQLFLPLQFCEYLWRQSDQLEAAGIKPMPECPFPFASAFSLAKELSELDIGWINPLPDEVAVLVINGAQNYIERYGDEINELISVDYKNYFDGYHQGKMGVGNYKVSDLNLPSNIIRDIFHTFKFIPELFRSDFDVDNVDDRLGVIRDLMLDLVGACIIVILGGTGIRISELAAINIVDASGKKADRSEKSLSGIFEIFYITSALVKGETSPRQFDWLAGMRLIGSDEEPPVIRAYRLLEKIFFFPRKLCNVNSLFVSMPPGRGMPRTEKGVGSIFGGHLRRWMHNFIEKNVDFSSLPDQSESPLEIGDLAEYKNSKGRCIKPTQFRKSFASFII